MSIFSGLSAFPLTPLDDDTVDEHAFAGLIERLVDAGVDSVTALGSTGSGAYLSRSERALVARRAVLTAGTTPVSSINRCRYSAVKFDTPMDLARPERWISMNARQVSTYLSAFGCGQWIRYRST